MPKSIRAGSPAKTSASQGDEKDSKMGRGVPSPLPTSTLWSELNPVGFCWKTSRGYSVPTGAATSGDSSVKWSISGMASRGELWTPASSEWRNAVGESSSSPRETKLSEILEPSAAEVLLECASGCRDHSPSGEAGESSSEAARGRAEGDRGRDGGSGILRSTPHSDGVRALNGMGEGVDDREGVEGSRGSEAVGFTKSSFGGYIPTDKGAGTLRAKGGDIGGGSENLAVSTYTHTLTAPTRGGRRDRIPRAVTEKVLTFPSRFGSNANVTEDQAQSFAHSAGAPAVLLGTSYDGFNQKVEEDGAHRTLRIGRDSSDFVIAPSQEGEDDLLPVGLDSHRYRCAGNGVVANVAEWIGRRIVAVDTKYASGTVAGYAVSEALSREEG